MTSAIQLRDAGMLSAMEPSVSIHRMICGHDQAGEVRVIAEIVPGDILRVTNAASLQRR